MSLFVALICCGSRFFALIGCTLHFIAMIGCRSLLVALIGCWFSRMSKRHFCQCTLMTPKLKNLLMAWGPISKNKMVRHAMLQGALNEFKKSWSMEGFLSLAQSGEPWSCHCNVMVIYTDLTKCNMMSLFLQAEWYEPWPENLLVQLIARSFNSLTFLNQVFMKQLWGQLNTKF